METLQNLQNKLFKGWGMGRLPCIVGTPKSEKECTMSEKYNHQGSAAARMPRIGLSDIVIF